MNFRQFGKDAKSWPKPMRGVDAVKKGFFAGTGIGKSLEKLARAAASTAGDSFSTSLVAKSLLPIDAQP